ncbi:hypothetical protein [Moraxella sp.]|uniref:hypothetical protein n=1 Tax=Moraxella sp. TaxID=479 RepID=UPI0026DB6E0E|nr:hypothetical protein [Moraxella sp.]MDO4894094.1 hypothetical protein [Moraxella sp.]
MKKILLSTLLFAAATAQTAEPFVGRYTHGGADWGAELWLLNNQKFCYAVSAGNLDLRTGGSWLKTAHNGNTITIELTEQKLPISDVVIVANPKVDDSTLADAQKQTGSRRILFLTPPALENALGSMNPLIGFSETEQPSGKFKWAYPATGGTPMYARIGIPEKARYVFVGSSENDKLYRFNIGSSRHAKLNPNPQAGRPPMDMMLTFNIQSQSLEEYGTPEPISAAAQQTAWQQCEPKAQGLATTVKGSERTLLNPESVSPLKPHYQADEVLESWVKE